MPLGTKKQAEYWESRNLLDDSALCLLLHDAIIVVVKEWLVVVNNCLPFIAVSGPWSSLGVLGPPLIIT